MQKDITFKKEEPDLTVVSKDEFDQLTFGSETERKVNGLAITADYLALEYENESGEQFHLTKQITTSDYHNNDDFIAIEYPEGKSYAIHIPRLNISDFFFLMGISILLYIITIVLTVLMIYKFICLWRYKNTGSYYKKRRSEFKARVSMK